MSANLSWESRLNQAFTNIDREKCLSEILAYLDFDLLRIHATEPPEFVEAQKLYWAPLLSWAEGFFQTPITITHTFEPPKQSKTYIQKVQEYLNRQDNHIIFVFNILTEFTKSIIITTGLLENHLSPQEACYAANLEDQVQQDRWGRADMDKESYAQKERDIVDIVDYLRGAAHGNRRKKA